MSNAFPIVISAPSGAGKSTLCRLLLSRNPNLIYSVSWTTRPPRPGESNSRHYYFVGPETFKEKARSGVFLEWAKVHGHYYGTPRSFVESAMRRGKSVLMAIDVQGGSSIARKIPETVRIFVLPPSWAVLRQRLIRRHDPKETVTKRLANARQELARAREYDYIVVNDKLSRAVQQIEAIFTAEGLKVQRNWNQLSQFK